MPSTARGMTWERATAMGLVALAVGCASGGTGSRDTGVGPPRDSGPRADAPSIDAGPVDTGPRPDAPLPPTPDAGRDAGPTPPDAADVCGSITCTDFQYCMAGVCVDYPNCRGDGTCPTPGDVCRGRRCVPGTRDIDGDGDPAATDCDESNPMRSSRLPEICDTIDNNCNGAADDGDPSAMCAASDVGGTCMMGVCGCPAGSYDIDRAVSGCECLASPGVTQGTACTAAIDLGNVADTMGSMTVTGNAIDREVWYRFRAVDTPDTTCDQFNVGIHLSPESAAEHEIWVVRGACDTGTTCTAGTYTDYNFAMDFREDRLGMLTGQCPCWSGTPVDNMSPCEDNSTVLSVRVRRRDGAPRSCSSYTLTITNGVD